MPLVLIVLGGIAAVIGIGFPPLLIGGVIAILIGFYIQARRNRDLTGGIV